MHLRGGNISNHSVTVSGTNRVGLGLGLGLNHVKHIERHKCQFINYICFSFLNEILIRYCGTVMQIYLQS